ncbi:MAG: hypothetical protein ABI878_14635 [Acidobacteriota bacterium]
MFLSNPAKSFLASALITTICGGCGFFKNYPGNAAPARETRNTVPFSVKEPEVYQAQFVSTVGDVSTVSFYARKGENWRLDLNFGSPNSVSIIRSDRLYSISSARKMFAEMPTGQVAADPDFVQDMTAGLLNQSTAAKFETLGRDGTVTKYRVTLGENGASEAIIYFDETVGMITREEFFSLPRKTDNDAPQYVYEVRELKADVDDKVFAIPTELKKVSWNEFSAAPKQPK